MPGPPRHPASRAAGLSMIELTVSMAMGAFVLSTMLYLYASSRQIYRSGEAVSRVQETGRFALEVLARDLRQAGNTGCVSRGRDFPADLSVVAVDVRDIVLTGDAVFGYQVASATSPALSTSRQVRADGSVVSATWANPSSIARVAGDVIQVSGILDAGVPLMDCAGAHNCPQGASLRLPPGHDFKRDDILIVADCSKATIFCASAIGTPGEAPSVSAGPECNCVAGDRRPSCAGPGGFRSDARTFTAAQRAVVARYEAVDYFIGEPGGRSGVRSLFRASTSLGTQEVVENVEDLAAEYGEDTNSDGAADVYRPAAAVLDWKRVVAVRVEFVVVSPRQERAVSLGTRNLVFRGAPYRAPNAAEHRLRQVFTTTVALRNRVP